MLPAPCHASFAPGLAVEVRLAEGEVFLLVRFALHVDEELPAFSSGRPLHAADQPVLEVAPQRVLDEAGAVDVRLFVLGHDADLSGIPGDILDDLDVLPIDDLRVALAFVLRTAAGHEEREDEPLRTHGRDGCNGDATLARTDLEGLDG